MSQSKIRIFKEFLITQYNFLVFYPFVMTLTVLTQALWAPERPRLWVWLLGGLVCYALYFVRTKVDNFIVVVLLHIVALVVQAAAAQQLTANHNPMSIILYLAFSIGFIAYSLRLRYSADNYDDRLISLFFSVGASAVLIMIQRYVSDLDWTNYYVYIPIVQVAIFFLVTYINEYLNFLMVNANSTGVMPEKEIFRSGIGFTGIYTFAGILILLAASRLTWLRTIMQFLLKLVRTVMSFLFGRSSGDEIMEPVKELEQQVIKESDAIAPLPQSNSSWIWDVIFVIILLIGAAIVLFLLYKALLRIIQAINAASKKKRKVLKADELNEIIDVREKLDISKDKNHRRKPGELFGFLSAQERIRRIYKKKVSQYKPNRLTGSEKQRKDDFTEERLKFYTAREMEERMETPFAEIYEKARYSDEECTSKDVKAMEAAFK